MNSLFKQASGSGKSTTLKQILLEKNRLLSPSPDKIIWVKCPIVVVRTDGWNDDGVDGWINN